MTDITRRRFAAALGSAAASPIAARGQQALRQHDGLRELRSRNWRKMAWTPQRSGTQPHESSYRLQPYDCAVHRVVLACYGGGCPVDRFEGGHFAHSE